MTREQFKEKEAQRAGIEAELAPLRVRASLEAQVSRALSTLQSDDNCRTFVNLAIRAPGAETVLCFDRDPTLLAHLAEFLQRVQSTLSERWQR